MTFNVAQPHAEHGADDGPEPRLTNRREYRDSRKLASINVGNDKADAAGLTTYRRAAAPDRDEVKRTRGLTDH